MEHSLPGIVMRNRNKLFRFGRDFNRVFRVPLNKFLNPVTGFGIVEFDEWLNVPDGVSTKEFIADKFGKLAAEMVEQLL